LEVEDHLQTDKILRLKQLLPLGEEGDQTVTQQLAVRAVLEAEVLEEQLVIQMLPVLALRDRAITVALVD